VEDDELYSSNVLAWDTTFDSRRHYNLTLFNIAGLRHHRDSDRHKVQDWLDTHYPETVALKALADKVGKSKSTFIRRYLQRLWVEAAKHHLINSDDSVKSISLTVGYHDSDYFPEVLKALTVLSPIRVRVRFRAGKSNASEEP